ncbi:MAG: BT4734/BF3469 family protein [Bacteroidota bacterium]
MEEIKISYFNNVYDTKPKDYDLEKWLTMTMNPPANLEEEVNRYRETLDKKLKEKLPCVTISASFKNIRNLENILLKNRLISIDVDRFAKSKKNKSNRCADMLLVKEMFMAHPSVLYTGYSVGGDGVYAIIRIDDAERLADYFEHFQNSLAHVGINIDNACKDYTRLRFFSVDKEAYLNPKATYFKLPPKQEPAPQPASQPQPSTATKPDYSQQQTRAREILNNVDKVRKICALVEKNMIDITSSYEDWYKVGGGLAFEFGEDGREYFRRLSQFHPDYNPKACDEKFDQCKRLKNFNFSSVLWVADSYGIKYKDC